MTPHPNIEGIARIARTFREISEAHTGGRGDDVVMDQSTITRNECATHACHAGWFALATTQHEWRNQYAYHKDGEGRIGTIIHHGHGADAMGVMAGYSSRYELEEWAGENPGIWGNEFGALMFKDSRAFDYFEHTRTAEDEDGNEVDVHDDPHAADFHIEAVADHWEGVHERLAEALAREASP